MSYKYVLSCVLDFQEFPNFFLHMKGSTAPLCMHLNPNPNTRSYQFLFSPRSKKLKCLKILYFFN